MAKTFLIFGREPALSFAEIFQFLGDDKKIIACGRDVVLLSDDNLGESAPALLGGVVKSGVIDAVVVVETRQCLVSTTTTGAFIQRLVDILEKHIQAGQKFHFGLSIYTPPPVIRRGPGGGPPPPDYRRGPGGGPPPPDYRRGPGGGPPPPTRPPSSELQRGEGAGWEAAGELGKTKDLGLAIKKQLKAKGYSARFVQSRHQNLSAVDAVKNKLLDKGVELCLIQSDDEIFIGQTQAVQPYEEYSQRDYGRPNRDPKRGMLPPKLAKIMVNLSQAPAGGLIIDPFCGSGTILQEALLLGYKVIGTDIDEKAIYDSKQNLEWLFGHYQEDLPDYKLQKMDARQVNKILAEQSADAVVSEFDLGPPLTGRESASELAELEQKLSDFYLESLELLFDILKPGRRAIIAWPYFRRQNLFVSAFAKLSGLGWQIIEPFPKKYLQVFPLSRRGTLLYGRTDQYVWREILILEKNKTPTTL